MSRLDREPVWPQILEDRLTALRAQVSGIEVRVGQIREDVETKFGPGYEITGSVVVGLVELLARFDDLAEQVELAQREALILGVPIGSNPLGRPSDKFQTGSPTNLLAGGIDL